MIQIKSLTKQYGMTMVLRGVNLHVREGEFVTLVGSNGAGKSTLMRIVATLLKPSSGEVTIGGWPLPSHATKVRQHIGMVSHHALLYGDLTAAENLSFYARLYGIPNRDAVVGAALKRVGLAARQRDAVRTFSRGMVQRLTIARATLHEPDVLLLDEPYTGLDQDATALLNNLLLREHEIGRTILLITHDLTRGIELSDRVAILNKGKIVHTVTRDAVSATEFVDQYRQIVHGKRVQERA